MEISSEQRAFIDTLHCERLSSNEENLRSVESFYNYRNESIADTLKNEAYQDDETGKVAYYVIKDQDGKIVFYFSLKCGMLYDRFIDDRNQSLLKALMAYLEDISTQGDMTQDEMSIVNNIKEKLRSHKGLSKQEIDTIPKKGASVLDDLEKEINDNITHVGSTFSGVELVHFCTNDLTRSFWDEEVMVQKLGVVIFWKFIVAEIMEVMKHVGCQYLFLFAADQTADEELVNYYRDNLNFKDAAQVATAKPIYDLTCKFMYQETANLSSAREYFFHHFNVDSGDV